jgi:hypothetical protein
VIFADNITRSCDVFLFGQGKQKKKTSFLLTILFELFFFLKISTLQAGSNGCRIKVIAWPGKNRFKF